MVTEALRLYDTTGGAFDITVYPLMDLWGFTTGKFAVPDAQELSALLAQCGSDKLTVNGDTIMLAEGQGIDLGGIAKGYTSGHLMKIFEEYDLVGAVVSLGGNVQCYRTKTDGSLWRCGIQDPQDPENGSAYLGVVSVADRAVITSGAYERYFVDEATGKTYHHILDPKTGYPAESGLLSVTVVSTDGMLADGLSTSCYVMGLEQSAEYWRNYGADFDLILMDENGEVYVTEPLSGQFTSDYKVHVISQEGISSAGAASSGSCCGGTCDRDPSRLRACAGGYPGAPDGSGAEGRDKCTGGECEGTGEFRGGDGGSGDVTSSLCGRRLHWFCAGLRRSDQGTGNDEGRTHDRH